MSNAIKLILATLCFVCLADMPYGYYQFVRMAGLIGFSVLAYMASQSKNQIEVIVYGTLALVFQPFFKLALGRELWNVVDVIVGAGLIISVFYKSKFENKSKEG